MSTPKVYEVLASVFIKENVKTCFGLLGDANMNWAAAMSAGECNFIYVRHEHCAVAAAMAFARSTQSVGVATVTCGPGLTQVMTALPAAVRANIPLIIFSGEAPVKKAWYNQGIDQKPFVEACGAEYVSLQHQPTMRTGIRNAFLRAKTEQRPIVLGVPMDLQNECWQQPLDPLPSSGEIAPQVSPITPSEESLQAAKSRIEQSRKIVIMAGLGALKAEAESACEKLAEQLGALLATTLPARGLFFNNKYYLGVAGGFSSEVARHYLSEADLIIAVGASLSSHNSDAGKLFKADDVLHIDVAPASINQGRQAATYHLKSDAKLGIEALCNLIDTRDNDSDNYWRCESIATEIRDTPADSAEFVIEEGLLDPRDVVSVLEDAIPTQWYTVNSSGHCSCFFAQMKNRPANRFLTIREFGAIGNGLSFAIGVCAAHPDEPVVLFDGDGSLLMHIQEFETIIRHRMNLLIIILNDGAYGSEIHKLRSEGLPDDGAVFGRPDFANVARGFGASGVTVTNLDDLQPLIQQFGGQMSNTSSSAGENRLTVIDVHVSDKVVSSVIRRSHAH